MKFILSFFLLGLFITGAYAQKGDKAIKRKPFEKIQWMTLDEVQEQLKITPRKVFVVIYNDGCGWCSEMDKKTFSNQKAVGYINEHFYAIRMNADTADTLTFKGKEYGQLPGRKTNELAAHFMNNKLSYPTSVFFDSKFENAQPIPGYLDLKTIEMVLKFVAEPKPKNLTFEKFRNEFKGTW